jgi:outer membrane protein OmpA-like peptidoglycan-associated protein
VTDVSGDRGYHEARFQTSERAYGSRSAYEWSEEYTSLFWRDSRGAFTIDPSQFMPVVRNVPLFPTEAVEPGQSWSAQGSEVHDFRRNFGIERPFRFPINVNYTYLRNEERGGIACAVIGINYEIFHKVSPSSMSADMYPTRVSGFSNQEYWWDRAGGRPVYYEEEFDFIFDFTSGDEVEFAGSADGELIGAAPLDREGASRQIQREIDEQGISGVSVAPSAEGVIITIENVNFPPNSAALLPAEQDKLRRIAGILEKFPDRDIAIAGHTARASGYTEEDYQALSEKRANAVGDFLLALGARRPAQVTTRGMGARMPFGDNATEEGRRKNRRVEITILEN